MLGELPKLKSLNLASTDVSGDLGALSGSKSLQMIRLQNTKITGNLEALRKATNLQRLSLDHTRVTGDLKALENATALTRLRLPQTKVAGDLKALRNAEGLREINLPGTQVTGNLASLRDLFERDTMDFLDLREAKVSGDLVNLRGSSFVHVDLSKCRIWGDIRHVDRSYLEHLDLSQTQVSGKFHETYGREGTYNANLKFLDISSTFVKGSISASRMYDLRTFKAAGCELHGTLPAAGFPSLVTLDLTSNKVSSVEDVPGRCRTLILAGNPNMSFATGVLRRGVERAVYIDLRNVSYTNGTVAWSISFV